MYIQSKTNAEINNEIYINMNILIYIICYRIKTSYFFVNSIDRYTYITIAAFFRILGTYKEGNRFRKGSKCLKRR